MKSALEGLRICDFSGQLAGAGATRFLAAMGAQVIRIEDPVTQGYWDALRGMAPFVDERRGPDFGGPFNNHNVEKLGITLNLRTATGKKLLRELVAISDVVTENFAPGVMARLGFPYEELRDVKEDIVYVSNSGFGHTGPYREFKTWGPLTQASCGLAFVTGLADQHAAGIGYSYMDHHGANVMTIAIMTGLLHRHRTGEGQWIDVSCAEAGALLNGPALLDFTVNGRALRRPGSPDSNRSESPLMAPHGIYPSAGGDNWVAIACRNDDGLGEHWPASLPRTGPPTSVGPRWPAASMGKTSSTPFSQHGQGLVTGSSWRRTCAQPAFPPPPSSDRASASKPIPVPRIGDSGRRSRTRRWATSVWTASPCTSRRPIGRSCGERRASASTTRSSSETSSATRSRIFVPFGKRGSCERAGGREGGAGNA